MNDERTDPTARMLDARLTRRTLLTTGGRLGAGALALGAAGRAFPAAVDAATPARPAASFDGQVAYDWTRLSLRVVKETPGFSALVIARALGYLGVTLYEALVPGMPGYRSLAGQLEGLASMRGAADPSCHWPLVANSALAAMARHLFPTASAANRSAIDALEASLAQQHAAGVARGVVRRSIARGQAVAAHIAGWAMSDGGHEGYLRSFPTDYVPPVGPGLWVPTPPAQQRAFHPYWGNNRPFVRATVAVVPPGPPRYSTEPGSAFHAEAIEVYETANTLTAEQREIALFWADNAGQTATPPGHCIAILTQLLVARGASLAEAAEAYARAGMAVSDALIACWRVKYDVNLLRPITWIQQQIDPAWGSQLPMTTPPYPEYPSGHAVQTGAFAQVMLDLFGDLPFTDHTYDGRGMTPRSYTSWNAMADEAAISRLFAGIHFRSALDQGVTMGRQIGMRIGTLAFGTTTG